jgi:SynChlorMet cassette protein ScmD
VSDFHGHEADLREVSERMKGMMKSATPIPNPIAVLREEFDDWAVLFNPDTAQAVGINPVGVAVWKLLDGKRSVEDVSQEIRDQYEGVPEHVGQDVIHFIEDLVAGGFVGYEVEGFD